MEKTSNNPTFETDDTSLSKDYEALLSALNQTALVSVTDNKGRITYTNDKFVEVSKYTRNELIGQNHRILKSGHQPESLFEDLWATISKGNVWRGEIKNRAKDGTYYWVDTSIAPTMGTNGKPESYTSVRFVTTDKQIVNEQIKSQQDILIESKAKNEAIIKAIGDGLVATNKKGEIILTNPAFERLLGWKQSEVLGKQITDVLPLLNEDGVLIAPSQRLITQVLEGRKKALHTTSKVVYFKHKNGTSFPVSTTISPIIQNNKVLGIVKVFRDISHEKEIDRAKSEFVSLASHQLRTPLTAINWYTSMLQAGDAGKLNEEQKKYIAEVQGGSQRMVDLVNALLNVSRIDLGTFMIEPEPTNLVDLCKKVVQDSEPRIFERKQKFVEHYPVKLEPVNIDPRLTRMVIENLVSNAIKYTQPKGEISLTLAKVKDNILITVKDNGYGIPKKQHSKIFGKLFRADNVFKHDTEGTGLGLYIAKSVVESAGGKIWFVSAENKGTSFYIEIPAEGMKAHSGSRRLD